MSEAAEREYDVRVHRAEDGSLWAEVPDLPGCFATGDDWNELLEAVQEAISVYVADDPDALKISDVQGAPERPIEVDHMRVKVPA